MMDYKMFKEIVAVQITNYMPEEFKDYVVEVSPVTKVNGVLDGLSLLSAEVGKSQSLVPTIFLNHMYEDYQRCENLQEVLQSAAIQMKALYQDLPPSLDKIVVDRDKIVMTLVNTEQNKSMLEHVPHREFQDLSIVYRFVLEATKEDVKSFLITNNIAVSTFHMHEQELYQAALCNTKNLFPPDVKNMQEVMFKILEESMTQEELKELEDFQKDSPNRKMYILSNSNGINGASSMLYEEELHKLAETMEGDLYVLPSSVHEVIVVAAATADPNELAEMVCDINMTQVSLEDRLSNQVYHYDKDLRTLTLASETPNRSLDNIVVEESIQNEKEQSR